MVYRQYCVRYQVLYWLLQCVPSFLTKSRRACFTISNVLGIRYCIGYCNGSHHSVLRCMKHALPSVIYQVLGIVLAIIVYPFIPHQDTQSMVYLKHCVRYQELYWLFQCVPSFLTHMHEECLTLSHLLGIRYSIKYYNMSHRPSLRQTKYVITSNQEKKTNT